jgi:hypothetical protein
MNSSGIIKKHQFANRTALDSLLDDMPIRKTDSLGAAVLGCALLMISQASASARTLNASDEAHLHVVNASGSLLIEEGPASGGLPGKVKVRFNVSSTVSGTFTLYPRSGGSITGHAKATLHSTGTYASFAGSLTITGGTGRYTHAHGTGGLYGTVNRHNDAIVVQTTGKLHY